MKILLLIIGTLWFLGCNSVERARQSRIVRVSERSPHTLQVGERPDLSVRANFSDYFEISDIVVLDPTPMVEEALDWVFYAGQFAVLDWHKQVYRFDIDGSYLGKIGMQGQGPGEYSNPTRLFVWDDRVVVIDAGTGSAFIYDHDGHFLRQLRPIEQGVYLTYPNLFYGDRWYVGDFSAADADVPNHAILTVSEDNLAVVAGFGVRFSWLHRRDIRREMGGVAWYGFTRVGQRIWTASPYACDLEIYDLDGRFVSRLKPGVNGVEPADFEPLQKYQERIELQGEKYWSGPIIHMAPYVFSSYLKLGRAEQRSTVWDEEGNLIVANIPQGPGPECFQSRTGGPYLITPISASHWHNIPAEKRARLAFTPPEDGLLLVLSLLK